MASEQNGAVRALVFANGDLNDGPAVRAVLDQAGDALIIAADGGARLAVACARQPHLVVGDLDSLPAPECEALAARGTHFERAIPDKDETDLELALLASAARGAAWIRIIGALGDRLDQMLANLALLSLPALAGCDVKIVAGRQTTWLIGPGSHALVGAPGDTVSLLPFDGDVHGITTRDLKYPLRGETLRLGPARGVSNVMLAAEGSVTVEHGRLIVVHTLGRA